MPRPRTIGFLSPLLDGVFFGSVLAGAHAVARQHGCRLVAIQATPGDVYRRSLASDQIDGWIVLLNDEGVVEMARQGRPLVMVSTHVDDLGYPIVLPDNHKGAREVVQHLLGHGHRRIAFLGNLDQPDIQQRYEGYRDALTEHGIALDPALIIQSENNLELGGRTAMARLIDAGLPCTAVVAGTDMNALGVIAALGAAGYRVPEDVAVVGFDDMEVAQTSRPPLTTARLRFDALGGTAAQLLLDQLDGRPVAAGIHAITTALIVRRSCGCVAARIESSEPPDAALEGREELLGRLVAVLSYPQPPDPGRSPEQIWPGGARLLHGLEQAVDGLGTLPDVEHEGAWHEAVELSVDVETLLLVLALMRRAGEQRLDDGDRAARARLELFLHRSGIEMMRARVARENALFAQLDYLARANYEICLLLLGQQTGEAQRLSWLRHTRLRWGCLGLWGEAGAGGRPDLTIAGVYRRDGSGPTPIGGRSSAAAFPPAELLPHFDGGADVLLLLPIQTASRDWGVLAIWGPLQPQPSSNIEDTRTWAALLGAALERETLLSSLAEQRETLRGAYERARTLADNVRELGCPVIPLLPSVLLVPLVGAIDSDRAQQIVETVLHGVSSQRADVVLLDITGVPLVDTQVANSLIQAAQAATLLGARVIMVGVRPEIAQSIVSLGISLRHITTQPTLAAALRTLQQAR